MFEYVRFVGAMGLFIMVLIGSCWFVLLLSGRGEQWWGERRREVG